MPAVADRCIVKTQNNVQFCVLFPQSPTSDEGATHSAPDPIPIPSFCYILVSGPEAVPIPDQGKDSNFPTLNTTLNALPTDNHYLDHDYEISRGTIYARVVHYQAEVCW